MLQAIREMSKSWIVKLFLGFLALSFAIWGIGDMFRGNALHRTVGKAGKVAVTVQALEQQFQASLPEARAAFGPELTDQQARQMGLLARTLNTMLEQSAIDQEVKRLGINVSDQTLLSRIAALPQFRDEQGRFNTQLWHYVLSKNNLSERAFLDRERGETERRLLLSTIANGTKPPQILIDNIYAARGAKRILEVLTLSNASIKDLPKPADETLQSFYQEHTDVYTAPEYRSMTIAKLSSEDATKNVTVTDDDLKAAYEARGDEFAQTERRDLVQVVLQDENKAKDFAAAAQVSKKLEATAKNKGYTPVALDRVDEKGVLPEIYASAFALEEGQISEPLKSPLGWHIVQIKKVYPSGKPDFEEIKGTLRETLQREKSMDNLSRIVNQMDDALAAGSSLEEMADSLKLRLIKIPAVDGTGKTAEGKEPTEFPAKEDMMRYAFSQASGETSQVIDDKQGNYLVVRTDEITPSQVRPFETIKDKVLADWSNEQRAQKAIQESENIAKALREGKAATSFAAQPGVEIRIAKPISLLEDADKTLPQKALPEIFQMKKGDVITNASPDKQYVLRLVDIVPVDLSKPDNARQKVVEDMEARMPYELLHAYAEHLHKLFPVTIDQELLETLKMQGS